jgi:STE24 endopeptidase
MIGCNPNLQGRAKSYQRKKQILTLFHLLFTPLLLWMVAATPLSSSFREWAAQLSAQSYGIVAGYFLFFSLFMLAIDLPFAFYSGYLLEHRYELSNHTLRSWAADFFKRAVLSFALSLALVMALYALIWHFPASWWLWAWAGYAAVSYILGKLFPVFIVPLFYRYGPVADESLKERVRALAGRYGMPVKNIFSLNLSRTTKKANAAFMGLGRSKRVVLSDTLLDQFSAGEIEMVLAHEIGHFKHRDIWKQLGFGLIASFFGFWFAFLAADGLSNAFGFSGVQDVAALPLIFLVFYAFSLVLMPLQNGFSRRMERAADRFALESCPEAEAFISCMEKLAAVNLADPAPHPAYEWFFYDHPSIGKRVEAARKWSRAKEITGSGAK